MQTQHRVPEASVGPEAQIFDFDNLISPLSSNSLEQAAARSSFRRTHSYLQAAKLAFPDAQNDVDRVGQLIERHEQLVRSNLKAVEDIARRDAHYDMVMACLADLPGNTAVQVVLEREADLKLQHLHRARPQAAGLVNEAIAHARRQRENGTVIDGAYLTDVMASYDSQGNRQLNGNALVRAAVLKATAQILEDQIALDVPAALRWLWSNIAFYAPASVEGADALIKLMASEGVDVTADEALWNIDSESTNADVWSQAVRMNLIAREMQQVIDTRPAATESATSRRRTLEL